MLELGFIYGYVKRARTAAFCVLDPVRISFPATVYHPFVFPSDVLYFAIRFDQPVPDDLIGTPMVRLTFTGKNPEPSTMTIEGHLSICHEDSVLKKFKRNIHKVEQYHIMSLQHLKVHWQGRNSSDEYSF